MRERPSPRHRPFALVLALLILFASAPAGTHAQQPDMPEATPTVSAEPEQGAGPREGVIDESDSADGPAVRAEAAAQAADPAAQAEVSAEPAPQLPEGYVPPPNLANLSVEDLSTLGFPEQTQGVVQLTVLAGPTRVRPAEELTYTFIYTNTGGTPASEVRLRATFNKWLKVAAANSSPNNVWQYCADNNCNPTNVSGPPVLRLADYKPENSNTVIGVIYDIGDLAAGQSGSFKVTMKVPANTYPEGGATAPRSPSASAQLFLNDNFNQLISENTGSALIIGPAFIITKARSDPQNRTKLYPLDTGEFTIRVTNDAREDAIPATNITVIDYVPAGSEYVAGPGDRSPTPTTIGGKAALVWTIPGPLNPGGFEEFKVRFKKLDVAPCNTLVNGGAGLLVSSAEMPLKPGSASDRYQVAAKQNVSYGIQAPVVVMKPAASPGTVPFGSESTITLKVRNYWPQPINGVELRYAIQPNARFIAGSANGATVISAPDGTTAGGTIVFRIDLAAGSMTTFSERSVSLQVRGLYTRTGTGTATVTLPAEVPSGCVIGAPGGVALTERLVVRKYTEATATNRVYYARQGEPFPYVISLSNIGVEAVDGITVVDQLPNEVNANFSYRDGSATIDDQPAEPNLVVDGLAGRLEWQDLRVEPGQTIYLRFELNVGGTEYRDYCNRLNKADMETVLGETINVGGVVCVKINPNIEITKELVDPADANLDPSKLNLDNNTAKEVKFRLRIRNNEGTAYRAALYDFLPAVFQYVRVESGFSGNPVINDFGHLEFREPATGEIPTLAPGETLEVVVVTKFTPPCAKATFTNELGYLFVDNQGTTQRVVTRPATVARVNYLCGNNKLEYRVSVDRKLASLADQVDYTLSVKNVNIVDDLTNATVTALLPEGFSFVSRLSSTSPDPVRTTENNREKLVFSVGTVKANATVQVVFRARTQNVLKPENRIWVMASADALLEALCRTECQTDQATQTIYATTNVEVRPLITYTPRILAANVEIECADPGSVASYELVMLNTNTHSYESTVVTTTLPLGLHYTRPIEGPAPQATPLSDGSTQLVWRGLSVPKKPNDNEAGVLRLEVQLDIGQVFGDLATATLSSSPDGLIPLADGVADPTVKVCVPDGPALAKDASSRTVDAQARQEFIYQIEVINPSGGPVTLSIEDQLPAELEYVSDVVGPRPTRTGNTLLWENLTVPAASGDGPGLLRLRFRVRVVSGEEGVTISNTARAINASPEVDVSLATVGVEVKQLLRLFMPFLSTQ